MDGCLGQLEYSTAQREKEREGERSCRFASGAIMPQKKLFLGMAKLLSYGKVYCSFFPSSSSSASSIIQYRRVSTLYRELPTSYLREKKELTQQWGV